MEIKVEKDDLAPVIQAAIVAAVTPERIQETFKETIEKMFVRDGSHRGAKSIFEECFSNIVRKQVGDHLEKMFEDPSSEFNMKLKEALSDAITRLFGENRDNLVSAIKDHFYSFLTKDRY